MLNANLRTQSHYPITNLLANLATHHGIPTFIKKMPFAEQFAHSHLQRRASADLESNIDPPSPAQTAFQQLRSLIHALAALCRMTCKGISDSKVNLNYFILIQYSMNWTVK